MATLTKVSRAEDFAAWAFETAELIEKRQFDDLDLQALVDEVRNLGCSEYKGLKHQLERLFVHLLKWAFQPEKHSSSWDISIFNARSNIEDDLEASPSLGSRLTPTVMDRIWRRACKRAARETRLPIRTFPKSCPWDLNT